MLQNDHKTLQETGIKPHHIAIAGGLAFVALATSIWPDYAYHILGALLTVALAVFYTWHIAEKLRIRREEQARAWSFANVCGPVLVSSFSPNETVEEVQARAAEWRRQLELSANPYWREIPLVVYPYQPMLFGQGQLSMSWNVYQRMAGEQLHNENLLWAQSCPNELKPIFLSQVMPQPAQKTEQQ